MGIEEMIQLCTKGGLSIGIFALCAWITVFIVKRLAVVIDKLSTKMDRFTDRVRLEHDQASKQHEALMSQHEEMIKTLGRINGFK